jgi:hypothetical protein
MELSISIGETLHFQLLFLTFDFHKYLKKKTFAFITLFFNSNHTYLLTHLPNARQKFTTPKKTLIIKNQREEKSRYAFKSLHFKTKIISKNFFYITKNNFNYNPNLKNVYYGIIIRIGSSK